MEDHVDTAVVFTEILAGDGYAVTTVGTYGEAVAAAAAEGRFDLLVSDISLPDGNGCDLCCELRRKGSIARAIAFTAHGYETDVKRFAEAGFDRHLLKPVETSTMRAAVREMLGGE